MSSKFLSLKKHYSINYKSRKYLLLKYTIHLKRFAFKIVTK